MQAEQSDVSATYTANLTIAALVASSAVAFSMVHRAQVPMPLILVVLLASFAALMHRHRSCSLLIVVFGTALIDFNSRVTLLGDDSWLRIASSAEKTLWASSAGGNAVLRAIVQNGMDATFLAPTCGVLTAGVLSWRAVNRADGPERLWGLVGAVLAGTLPIFSRGFVEVTPIGFPVAVAALVLAEDRASERGLSMRKTAALILAGCAVFTHGVYLLVVALLVLRAGTRMSGWTRLRRTAFACLIPAMTVTFLAGMTYIAGFRFVAGDSRGGGDGRILPAEVIDPVHLKQTLMLIVAGSPLGLMRLWRAAESRMTADDFIAFGLSGSFLLLWNFDLGWGRDLDLVLAASVVHLGRLCRPEPIAVGHGPKFVLTRVSQVVGLAAFATVASVTGWQVVF